MNLNAVNVIIGASEASPYLVFNAAILSVCLSVSVCTYVCMDGPAHNNLLLGVMILTDFYVNCCAWAQLASYRPQARLQQVRVAHMGTF